MTEIHLHFLCAHYLRDMKLVQAGGRLLQRVREPVDLSLHFGLERAVRVRVQFIGQL